MFYYTVTNIKTGEIIIENGTREECAKALGLKGAKGFSSAMTRMKIVNNPKYSIEIYKESGPHAKPVLEVDPATGKVLREFPSARAAGRSIGYCGAYVGRICSRKENPLGLLNGLRYDWKEGDSRAQ